MTLAREAAGLDRLLPPQVKGGRYHAALRRAAAAPGVRTILEIGASSGAGSTEALVAGALANPGGPPALHTIEVSKARFAALVARHAGCPFVHPYNVSSIRAADFPGEEEVARFYRDVRSKLRNNRLEKVLGWLRQDLAYLSAHPDLDVAGLELVRAAAGVETFDVAVIDGSEFTGERELELVLGARFILLDDTRSFKNWSSEARLRADPRYRRIAGSRLFRNGWSAFERR
jgi:hypothetical protein